MTTVRVARTQVWLTPDPTRVVTRTLAPTGEPSADGRSRVDRVLARILALSAHEVSTTLKATEGRFSARHRNLEATFETNFEALEGRLDSAGQLSAERRRLIGAYFTSEYSIEAAALTNPSIVPAPDQRGLAPGAKRFVLSLRAIGEGHISSIEFRSGVVDARGHVQLEPSGRHVGTASHESPVYHKDVFRSKLEDLNAFNDVGAAVLDGLSERFTMAQLEARIRQVNQRRGPDAAQATQTLHWLASSNYQSSFDADSLLSERVLFPAGPAESHGMEDARFVRFTDEEGAVTYFATYTAYDGHQIMPQLIETHDFSTFLVATLNGKCARNKGIALFPRKIAGRYAALSRLDNENSFVGYSDNIRFWHESQIVQEPRRTWELMHLGNCGSPLETPEGWLVITHGVGTMRQYALGAILLDLDDPTRVIGHLAEPLLEPTEEERDGYVPNVVYSCGSMIADGRLILPYGTSDVGARIATVDMDELLSALTGHR